MAHPCFSRETITARDGRVFKPGGEALFRYALKDEADRFLGATAEIDRLDGPRGGIEFDFVEREATPQPLMELSTHLQAAGLSLADTISVIERFGVDRCRSTVHNWMRKADLQPTDGKAPERTISTSFASGLMGTVN